MKPAVMLRCGQFSEAAPGGIPIGWRAGFQVSVKVAAALAFLLVPVVAQQSELPITRLQEIRQLPAEIAGSGVPVAVDATVLYADPANGPSDQDHGSAHQKQRTA